MYLVVVNDCISLINVHLIIISAGLSGYNTKTMSNGERHSIVKHKLLFHMNCGINSWAFQQQFSIDNAMCNNHIAECQLWKINTNLSLLLIIITTILCCFKQKANLHISYFHRPIYKSLSDITFLCRCTLKKNRPNTFTFIFSK